MASPGLEYIMKDCIVCPHCGNMVYKYRNPFPTVDIIIELEPVMWGRISRIQGPLSS